MTTHQLPDDVREEFATLSGDARDDYIVTLASHSWGNQAIAEASGLSRERVRQIVRDHTPTGIPSGPIPTAPVRPAKALKFPRVPIDPSPETLARLRALQSRAEAVRGNGKANRTEAEEYSKLIDHANRVEGVSLYRLAQVLGRTQKAMQCRMVRYGYRVAPTGTSKVYTPIKSENRA